MTPESLIEEAFDLIKTKSIMKDQIDWEQFEAEFVAGKMQALSFSDAHKVIRQMLKKLGDRHSHLIAPGDLNGPNGEPPSREIKGLIGKLLDGEIGYISLPTFGGLDDEHLDEYAQMAQTFIRELDQQDLIGWIIDLRQNGGGNMWPMLAGIGPLLAAEHVGTFVDPFGGSWKWIWKGGGSCIDAERVVGKAEFGKPIRSGDAPMVVLIGPKTLSSGEATAIAFIGRPRTLLMGRPSGGLSTSNEGLILSDGSMMPLTTSTFADRLGRVYGGVIKPDVLISENEDALLTAKKYLHKMSLEN